MCFLVFGWGLLDGSKSNASEACHQFGGIWRIHCEQFSQCVYLCVCVCVCVCVCARARACVCVCVKLPEYKCLGNCSDRSGVSA